MNMETQIMQALARGYGHPENSDKSLDPDLIMAMTKELIEFFQPTKEVKHGQLEDMIRERMQREFIKSWKAVRKEQEVVDKLLK